MDRSAVTASVVVVGPAVVCGPGPVNAELATIALASIDDRSTVYAERVVAVTDVWCDVMRAALAGECDAAVLVVPSWWPRTRVELVEAAMLDSCARVTVLTRGRALVRRDVDVVELAPDCAVVHLVSGERHVLAGDHRPGMVADAVLAALPAASSVLIDVPDGVPTSALLASELARRVRARGTRPTVLDDVAVRHEVERLLRAPATSRPVRTHRAAVLAGALAAIVGLVAAALDRPPDAHRTEDATWIVEGRVAFEVPSRWAVERVVSGPGSARVQAVSPEDPRVAIHVTQARVRLQETREDTADALRAAFADQPRGRFVDFTAGSERAGRPAVLYRELRAETGVDWVVLLDHGVRIAIGCQHAGAPPDSDPACERAVRSAHAVP